MAGETGSPVDEAGDESTQFSTPEESRIESPPTGLKEFFQYMGPVWIFSAAQIGAGEAIFLPITAAYLGMNAIWLLPVVGFTKVFGQYYLVNQAVTSGDTFMKWLYEKSWWLKWVFYYVLLGGIFQALSEVGHVATVSGVLVELIPFGVSRSVWILVVVAVGFLIAVSSFNVIEKVSTVFLWTFLVLITIVGLLVWPPLSEWVQGFTTFPGTVEALGGSGWYIVAIAFGWIGAGFNATISYVFAAKDKGMGMLKPHNEGLEISTEDLTDQEVQYLQGWRKVVLWQNVIASVLLVVFSTFIWVATAQTLYPRGIRPSGFDAIVEMGSIFGSIFGEWSAAILLIAVGFVVFTSLYTAAYSVCRMYTDALDYHGILEKYDIDRKRMYQALIVIFLAIPLLLATVVSKPIVIFALGGILFAPIIGMMYIVALYLLFTDPIQSLQPQRWWAVAIALFAALASISVAIIGLL